MVWSLSLTRHSSGYEQNNLGIPALKRKITFLRTMLMSKSDERSNSVDFFPSPFAKQWNHNVRSSILIMIVTYLQTGANGSSRSSLSHSERAENWACGPAHRWLCSVGCCEEEVTNMETPKTLCCKWPVSSWPEVSMKVFLVCRRYGAWMYTGCCECSF